MKPDEKKTQTPQQTSDNTEAWTFVIVVLVLCITIVFTTRMYVDGHLIDSMIEHYTLRGKDVVIKDQQLVFINN